MEKLSEWGKGKPYLLVKMVQHLAVSAEAEDVKERFDTVIESFNTVKERLDRHQRAQEERLERIESRLIELGHDLNEHRYNTELHGQRKERAS